ncbi:MAG: TIGR03986 family type III CRISPR-associated RAMP protein [Promethearchaeota archaeon]
MSKKRFKSAKAPYNFIPLNEKVVDAPAVPDLSKYHKERYSGLIEYTIETITPLFIGKNKESPYHFNINKIPIIPASSLRGMIRTLIQISSFGKFDFFEDKKLFFRSLAERPLRNLYKEKMSNRKAGFLCYDTQRENYYIITNNDDQQLFYKVEERHRLKKFYIKVQDNSYYVWSGFMPKKKVYYVINFPTENLIKKIYLEQEDIICYREDKNRNIPKEFDLLKMAKDKSVTINNKKINLPMGAPIFFIEYKDINNRTRIAFGHTPNFRIPYIYSIGDHIPSQLKSENHNDFAETIFGKENKWASRVFFSDAKIQKNQKNIYCNQYSLKILSTPKPTTFAHYLNQPNNAINNKDSLNHWDSKGINIRGYKLYWHRNTPSNYNSNNKQYCWHEGEIYDDTQHITVKPIKRNVKFEGQISFENLLKEELGALLFVLDLPENCFHKIGMGKPLGLGTIKITISLSLIDRNERYISLFENNKQRWKNAMQKCKKEKIEEFKKEFEKYILKKLNNNNITTLWELSRLEYLKVMLSWDNNNQNNWLEKTRYMFIKCDNSKYDCICQGNNCNEFNMKLPLLNPKDIKES